MNASIYIKGIGIYTPEKVLTNADLEKMVDTSNEWIIERTGIKERRIASDTESTSDMGAKAGIQAIKNAGLTPSDIDLVIVATMTPDMIFPSTATIIQSKIEGLRNIPAFDISAACSGFLFALQTATDMMKGGSYKNVLLIGAEKISSQLDWEDRTTCVLFGDAGGAVVLSKTDTPDIGILGSTLSTDGSRTDLLCMPAGGSKMPACQETLEARGHFLKMNGREIFKLAVKRMEASALEILERFDKTAKDIDWFIPHQANIRIIESLANRMGIPMEQFVVNVDKYGNTSAASIILALYEAQESGKLKSGSNILLVAFGAGLTWGATLLKWF